MKSNILNHFAINDLKTHHKDTWISLITLITIALLCSLVVSLTPLFGNINIIQHQQQYGSHDFHTQEKVTLDEINHMKININGHDVLLKDADIKYSYEQNRGYASHEYSIDYVGHDLSILAISLKEGKLPENGEEIAVQESVLDWLGYEHQLNQTIEIPYYHDEKGYLVGEWKVVGLLEPTGTTAILQGEAENELFNLFIDVKDGDTLENYYQYNLVKSISDDAYIGTRELDILIVMIEFVLFILGCIVLSGMTIAAFDNRKDDYALLRGVGATNRQLYYVVLIQSIILCLISLIVAGILSYGILKLMAIFVKTVIPIQFQLSRLSGVVFIIFLMTLISYFMPARGACRRALTGSFEGTEFQYFYYRYKKLHQMRPFYLGWRQLVNHKKQMIVKVFLIFITSLMMMSIASSQILSTNYQLNKNFLSQVAADNDITLTYESLQDTAINEKDFDVYNTYAQDIRYFRYFDTEIDRYVPRIYCFDEDIKKEFSIQDDLESGQIIVISGSSDTENKTEVIIQDKPYEIKSQIVAYEENLIIMSQLDYQQYADVDQYQSVKIYFTDIHQKTKGLIAFAKQNSQKQYNVSDSLFRVQRDYEYEYEDATHGIPVVELCVIFVASVIYVYQLSYEILKQRETIATYQLLGWRKFEIWKIYAYKSSLIALLGLVFALYYHFADCFLKHGGNGEWKIFLTFTNFLKQTGPVLIWILILIVLSLTPIYAILKKDGLENKNMRE